MARKILKIKGSSIIDVTPEVLKKSELLAQKINEINLELEEKKHILELIQPKKEGMITISLNNCGAICFGCPHVKWLQWKENKNSKKRHFIRLQSAIL